MRPHKSHQESHGVIGGKLSRWAGLCLGVLFPMAAFAQAPNSVQIPYASTAVGIPAGSTQTYCSAAIGGHDVKAPGVGDNCPPTQATLSTPQAVVIDPATSNMFIADEGNDEIRVIYKSGAAELTAIVDGYNNLSVVTSSSVVPGYIYNHCGEYSGTTTSITSSGGSCGNSAVHPIGLAIDPGGNLLDSEGSSRMRMAYVGGSQGAALIAATTGKIGPLKLTIGYEYPIMYSSLNAYYGDGGPAILALTHSAKGIAMDANENVYIADAGNNAIRMINGSTGIITTIAGSNAGSPCTVGTVTAFVTAVPGYQAPPSAIGTAGGCPAGFTGEGGAPLLAELSNPSDVILDAYGNLYIADYGNARVRAIYLGTQPPLGYTTATATKGNIYTVVGGGTLTVGGLATQIKLSSAGGLGFDAAGNLYIADTSTGKIWEVSATAQVATIIAGGGVSSAIGTACSSTFSTGPTKTYTNGDGCLGTLATLTAPTGRISFDTDGNLYVADSTANVVRKFARPVLPAPVTAVGSLSPLALAFAPLSAVTVAGTSFGVQGISTGDFRDAGGSTCNTSGTQLTAGQPCYLNVNFTPTEPGLRLGGVQVTASSSKTFGTNYVSGTATGAAIALDSATPVSIGSGIAPLGVTSDPSGAVYVSDKTSGSVLKYSSATSSTATALIPGLSSPAQVFVDGEGNVLTADAGNNRIAIYTALTATVSYLTGYASPQGVAVDGEGNIYIADTGNNRVVQIAPNGALAVVTSSVSGPTQLSFDGSGNLYIVDAGNSRVVELPGGTGSQVVVPTGTFVPISIGIDAANDLYVLDKASSQVGFISAQGATTTTLLSGLTAPASVSVDSTGDVYVADTSAGITYLNRQQISTSFFPLNVGQSSTFSSFIVTNIGSTALKFSGTTAYSGTGNTQDFQVSPSTTNGCSVTSAMASGFGCSVSAVFAPVALGNFSEKLTFPSNASNASTATATLTGSGVNLANSSLTISSTPSASSSISYGSPITLTFALAQSGTTAATGQIQVQVNGIKLTTLTVQNGSATYTFNPQAGTFVIAGQYTGDSNYVSSYATLTLTVVPAATTTTLAYSGTTLSVQGTQVPAYVLTATVKSSAVGVTGVVSFSEGSTALGIASLNASGVATLTLPSSTASYFAFSNPVFTASYLGGANFAGSTSNSVTVNGDMGLSALATTLAEPQGAVASTTITVTPYLGLSGNVTFACSNLPANSLCRFLPNTLTFSGTNPEAAQSVQLQLYTDVVPTLAKTQHPYGIGRSSGVMEAGFTFFCGLTVFVWRRRRTVLGQRLLLILLLAGLPIVSGLGLSGCGGGNYYNYPTEVTPVGSTVFTLTATDSSGATESIPLTMIVGPAN